MLNLNQMRVICTNLQKAKTGFQETGMLNVIAIAEAATSLLDAVFGKGKHIIPTDVGKIAGCLELELIECDLSSDADVYAVTSELIIRPQIFGDGTERKIYCDKKTTLYSQQYSIAFQTGYLLCQNDFCPAIANVCPDMPMLPIRCDDLVADTFAGFLLVPVRGFLSVLAKEVRTAKNNDRLLKKEDWSQVMSTYADIPYYYAVQAYQNMRHVMQWMYGIYVLGKEGLLAQEKADCPLLAGIIATEFDDELVALCFR